LKDATAELAGQLHLADRTLDSDVVAQGITSVKAGSVAVTFSGKSTVDIMRAIPEIVHRLLVPSWITDELFEVADRALFDVVSE
jgi:hypothetical protein